MQLGIACSKSWDKKPPRHIRHWLSTSDLSTLMNQDPAGMQFMVDH